MKFRRLILYFILSFIILCLVIYQFNYSWWWMLLLILIFQIPVVLGAIFIGHNFFIHSINSLSDIQSSKRQPSDILLSFDDGVHPEYTPRILDILKEHHIRAMFFIIGKHIESNTEILKRMWAEGHVIGNHSYTHDRWFDLKSTLEITNEIRQVNQSIKDILGAKWEPIYFRPPYGVTNPNVAKAILQTGMVSVGWNVRSMDTIAKSKDELLKKLKSKTMAGSIILLHDRCAVTVDTLTDYIVFCKEQGFTFTTL